jgi:hypothetical protein
MTQLAIVPFLVGAMVVDTAWATDAQRREYDQMVDARVREADEYIAQKQRQYAQRYAEQLAAKARRAQQLAETREDEEDDAGYRRFLILLPPLADRPPWMRPPARPPWQRPPCRPHRGATSRRHFAQPQPGKAYPAPEG